MSLGMLDRKLLRDLRSNAGVLLAIAAIIAVGVACFVAMRSLYHNLGDAKSRFYSACRMADFTIDLKKAPVSVISELTRVPGVAEVRPRIRVSVTVNLGHSTEPLNGLALSIPERHGARLLNDIVLTGGSDFGPRRGEEVLVNKAFADAHGIRPGDSIFLVLNNRRQELRVVGTASSSEFVYLVGPGSLIPDPEHFGVFYLKHSYLEEVFDFRGACNEVVGRLTPEARERPGAVLQRAERMLSPYGVITSVPRRDQISNRFLTDEIESLGTFAFILPGIFLVVAALVLGVLMARLVDQQRTVIGTLKALGYDKGPIMVHMLKFGVVVGLAGGLIGSGLGAWMADAMTSLFRRFFQLPDMENRFVASIHATGLLLSMACAVAGVSRSCARVLALEPARAMRPNPPERGGPIVLERVPWIWDRLSTAWRMVLRHVFRHRRRTLVSLVATAMATSLLVVGLMARDARLTLVDFQFRKVMRSDIDLALRDKRGMDAKYEAERLISVDRAEPVLDIACTLRNGTHVKRVGITGLAKGASLSVPSDQQGRPVRMPEKGLMLGRTLARQLHVDVGDELMMEPSEGRRDPRRVRVAALSDGYLGLAAYADIDYLCRLMDETFALSRVQMAVDHDKRRGRMLDRAMNELAAFSSVNKREDLIRNLMATVIDANRLTTGLLTIFSGLIVFATALNAALVGLEERRREVATLLVMGYSPRELGGLFLRENLTVTFLGTLLGMPLGEWLFTALVQKYQTDMFRIPMVPPWTAWGTALLIGLVFGILAHLFVRRSIARTDWIAILKGFE